MCAFPNLFITIAPAEWKFPMPSFLEAYKACVFAAAYILALHMYYLVQCLWYFLANLHGHVFFRVLEWVMKTQYQERRTRTGILQPGVYRGIWRCSKVALALP